MSNSSQYNGTYVKTVDDPTFWKVDEGKRLKIHTLAEVYNYGLRKVVFLSQAEIDAIPLADGSTDAPPNTAVLTFSDGIDAEEASAAGKALNERKGSK